MTIACLDHRQLYRLPWSLTDNIISWLEPTKECNIHCEGCYSANARGSHKTLNEIRADLDVFERYRRTDVISITGGEPLVHPRILDVVALVASRGLKPLVNTNGHSLTPSLLRELKRAGLKGMTFHVDSHQARPGAKKRSEVELNELRSEFAERVAEAGGLTCAFNATVYDDTLPAVPDVLSWAVRNADKVNVMVFIAFRQAVQEGFDYYVGNKPVELGKLTYTKARPQRIDISAEEIVTEIRKRFPDFEPAAYLNGTEKPDSLKWLLAMPISDGERILGCAGPKFVELTQVLSHFFRGRYLGYAPPQVHGAARSLLMLSPIDRGLRRVAAALGRRPLAIFKTLHLQTVMFIQPIDILSDGRQSMCDSCPDMTVHEGKLVWSCRLDERLKLGGLMRTVPTAATGSARS